MYVAAFGGTRCRGGWSERNADAGGALGITQAFGYIGSMPTVHREQGFQFRIYPDDHAPSHVHA